MNWLDIAPPPWVSLLIIATSVILIVAAVCMWFAIMIAWIRRVQPHYRLRWPIAHRSVSSLTDPVLYVGEMVVSDKHLKEDLYLEIAARSFNATDAQVIIKHVRGYVTYKNDRLPSPTLLMERGPRDGIVQAQAEFLVVFEQRMPKRLAEQLCNVSATDRIALDLERLNIIMALHDNPSKEARLPVYDGMTLYRDADRLLSGRIIKGTMAAGIKAGG